jgi:hypothetical protein
VLAWQALHDDGYKYPPDRPAENLLVNVCDFAVDKFVDVGATTLINLKTVPLARMKLLAGYRLRARKI